MQSTTHESPESALLPPAPRDRSAFARRRSWTDPRVRFWWLTGLLLLAAGFFFTGQGWLAWRRLDLLVREGVPVEAKISATYNEVNQRLTLPGKAGNASFPVTLKFPWHDSDYETKPSLAVGYHEFLVVGNTLHIHVNPNDPEEWTVLTEVTPVSDYVIGGLLVLGALLLLIVVGGVLQRRILNVWRRGAPIHAVVLESRHSAMAPRSCAVRCTPIAENDVRVFNVYVPSRLTALGVGDPLWVLAAPGSTRAVAAAWFLAHDSSDAG